MHVNSRKIATAGLLVALTVVFIYFGTMLETNTLFFIIAAAFCVGIAIREWGLGLGFAFLIASILLNIFLVPNKLYCITFGGMALYIWLVEFLWKKIADAPRMTHRKTKLWVGKYLIFNVLYVPAVLFMPQILFAKELTKWLLILFLLLGQVALVVFEIAYAYFQERIWGKMRVRLLGE